MLDHVTLKVTDLRTSLAFYENALKPLGITRLYGEGEHYAGIVLDPDGHNIEAICLLPPP